MDLSYFISDSVQVLGVITGLSIAHIAYERKPINYLSGILHEAHNHNLMDKIVSIAKKEYPEKSEDVQEAFRCYSEFSTG